MLFYVQNLKKCNQTVYNLYKLIRPIYILINEFGII